MTNTSMQFSIRNQSPSITLNNYVFEKNLRDSQSNRICNHNNHCFHAIELTCIAMWDRALGHKWREWSTMHTLPKQVRVSEYHTLIQCFAFDNIRPNPILGQSFLTNTMCTLDCNIHRVKFLNIENCYSLWHVSREM